MSIHFGHFLTNNRWRTEVQTLKKVQVIEPQEKGSDVNLASYILIDAFESKYDVAVVISNDSDLVFPIEYVKRRLGKVIGLLNPHSQPSRELLAIANFYKPIRKTVLQTSQFPENLKDSQGDFFKPKTW